MKPAPFDYVAPATIEEAVAALDRGAGDAIVLAGGQTLLPLLALRMSNPALLVDVNRTAGLTGITAADGVVRIGAMERQNRLLGEGVVPAGLPALARAIAHVGHHQTRNRGTIGGSIALGEPAAELPATAVALDARIELRSVRGTRLVPAEDYYEGPYATAIEPDELVTAILFPEWPAGSITIFRELARRPGDFALVGLVGALSVSDGRIARAGLAWFGMGPTPIKAYAAEASLIGRRLDAIDLRGLAEAAVGATDPFDDHHATADYRRTVGRRLFAAALEEALDRRQAA